MLKSDSFINHILILILIVLSGSLLFVGFTIPVYILSIIFILLCFVGKKKISKKEFKIFCFSFGIILLILIFNFIFSSSTSFGNYFTVISLLSVSLLISMYFYSRKIDIVYYLYKVLKYTAIFSLIGFVLIQFSPAVKVDIGSDDYKVYRVFYLFFYGSSFNFSGFQLLRNQGIFWEPGVLSVYTNILLFLSLFKYKNRKNSILAGIVIISTFSTSGIFILLFQLIFYFGKTKLSVKNKLILLPVIISLLIFVAYEFLEKKDLASEKSISSYGMRTFDLYSGAMVAINNPLLGIGINKEAYLLERNKYLPKEISLIVHQIENRGNSNSILQLFFSFGLPLGLAALYLFFKQDLFSRNKRVFFIIIFISLCAEPLLFTPFFMLIISSGLRNRLQSYNKI